MLATGIPTLHPALTLQAKKYQKIIRKRLAVGQNEQTIPPKYVSLEGIHDRFRFLYLKN